ncbi:hypothetical protein FE257_011225 [Aspergillus nanangensis]|uniref:Uncharacterized protein n=1 Tax=Aspergillus nanangensis TaxID=2582783 RepID=A0AAD4CHR9_ASPNN|nr:hypothetical protein FE257_011225 [Aspergillus nanangensis]
MFNLFSSKSSQQESTTSSPSWNPNSLTMDQPAQPSAMQHQSQVVTEQPTTTENMEMRLRGGGGGDVCCGICAGIACFECCEICC